MILILDMLAPNTDFMTSVIFGARYRSFEVTKGQSDKTL